MAKNIPLRDVLGFGRGLGWRALQGLDATGVGSATFRLAGSAWPFSPPALTGRAELHAVRLLVPGLTEPLNVPQASIQVNGGRITVNPVTAVLGTSVFSGRLSHQGDRKQPWEFDLRANHLIWEQGALWFDALGRRKPVPLLERLPGLNSFSARRAAASTLFGSLNAHGRFATPSLSYRTLTLGDFRGRVEISGRLIRLTGASFRAGGGRAQASGEADLNGSPAVLKAEASLTGFNLQTLTPRLPAALQGAHGVIKVQGEFETRGLSREEMSSNLRGKATISIKSLTFGSFDPLEAFVHELGQGSLEPLRGQIGPCYTALSLEIRDRRALLTSEPLELSGARLSLAGTYSFDRVMDLKVRGQLRHLRRRWLTREEPINREESWSELHLTGPVDRPVVTLPMRVSRTNP
jgi:autotransporter translocation and assembly factor TamB